MSSEFYNLEKAAEVLSLPTAEVNRLREQNRLRAFRDGSTWKFRKVDVDKFLADTIRSRSKNNEAASDGDFDLLGLEAETETVLADEASLDDLVSELPSEEGMISVAKDAVLPDTVVPKGGDFALDDDLIASDDDLLLSSHADDLLLAPADEAAVDLAQDDDLFAVVNDAPDSSLELGLSGDSGLALLDAGADAPTAEKGGNDAFLELDDDDILSLAMDDEAELMVDNAATASIPVEEEFQLTPDSHEDSAEDSDSASQVLALDDNNMFAGMGDATPDAGAFESPFGTDAPVFEADSPAFDTGGGFGGAAFDSSAGGAAGFTSSGPAFTAAPTSTEADYGPWSVVSLGFAAALLGLSGVMVLDLIVHIWSWGEPFVISSTVMNTLAQMAGLQ